MNTRNIALDYLRKARARALALDVLYGEGSFDDVVREAQEIVELVLKGALRWVGVDPPKAHEVSKTLKAQIDLFPAFWKKEIETILGASVTLFEERGHAFYGDEGALIPPSELFDRADADGARGAARDILALYVRLIEGREE